MDSMDKKHWESSEVIKEFEKRMARAAILLKNKLEVVAQAQVSEKLNKIKTDTESANKQMSQLMQNAKNLSDDGEPEEEYSEENDINEFSAESVKNAREALLAELREMANTAADSGNTKLAYKIERTIEELVYEE